MIKRLSLLAASLILATSATAGVVPGGSFNSGEVGIDLVDVSLPGLVKFDPSVFPPLSKARLTISIDLEGFFDLANRTGVDLTDIEASVSILATVTVGGKSFGVLASDMYGPFTLAEGDDLATDFFLFAKETYTIDPIDWTSFSMSGGGSLPVICNTQTSVATTPSSINGVVRSSSTAICSGSIEYTFDDAPPTNGVPEPGTLALIGLALAGMGFTARRRNAT